MSRADEMLAQMTTACDICGLRGPHVCVSLEQIIESRPGAGRTYPSGAGVECGELYRPKDGTETAKAAAIRLGVDQYWLGTILRRLGMRRTGAYWRLAPAQFDEIVRRARDGEGDRRFGKRKANGGACPSP